MDEYVLGLWDQVKFNFFFILGVIISVSLLRMFLNASLLGIFCFIAAAISFKLFLFGERKVFVYFKSIAVLGLIFLGVFVLTSVLGWLGVFFVLLAFLVYKFYNGWNLFMRSTRKIESMLFGKPLDKKEFEKGAKPSIYKEEFEEEKEHERKR